VTTFYLCRIFVESNIDIPTPFCDSFRSHKSNDVILVIRKYIKCTHLGTLFYCFVQNPVVTKLFVPPDDW